MRVGWLIPVLVLCGCSSEPPPSDAEVAGRFAAHRGDFDAMVAGVYEGPAITRIELRNGHPEVTPVTVPETRFGPVVARMKSAGISQVEVFDGKRVSFLVYSVGLGVSGRSKTIEYGPLDCRLVTDTDAALAEAHRSTCASKVLEDGWYIRADD